MLYVYGNWDYHLPYDYVFNKRFVHLHGVIASVGELQLVGFSGCASQWGQNPSWRALLDEVERTHRSVLERLSAAKDADQVKVRNTRAFAKYAAAWSAAWKEASVRNRQEVVERVRKSQHHPRRFILVSHERLSRLPDDIPNLGVHLFGHRHGFKVSKQRGTTFVNVSALDPWTTSGPQYGVIEWTVQSGVRVLEKQLPRSRKLRLQCMGYRARHKLEPDALRLPVARSPYW